MENKNICMLNLKQLGLAIIMFQMDNNGILPNSKKWREITEEYYSPEKDMLICPSSVIGCGYLMNKYLSEEDYELITEADRTVLLFESDSALINQDGGIEDLSSEQRHADGCHILFADGNVDLIGTNSLHTLKWSAQ